MIKIDCKNCRYFKLKGNKVRPYFCARCEFNQAWFEFKIAVKETWFYRTVSNVLYSILDKVASFLNKLT